MPLPSRLAGKRCPCCMQRQITLRGRFHHLALVACFAKAAACLRPCVVLPSQRPGRTARTLPLPPGKTARSSTGRAWLESPWPVSRRERGGGIPTGARGLSEGWNPQENSWIPLAREAGKVGRNDYIRSPPAPVEIQERNRDRSLKAKQPTGNRRRERCIKRVAENRRRESADGIGRRDRRRHQADNCGDVRLSPVRLSPRRPWAAWPGARRAALPCPASSARCRR